MAILGAGWLSQLQSTAVFFAVLAIDRLANDQGVKIISIMIF